MVAVHQSKKIIEDTHGIEKCDFVKKQHALNVTVTTSEHMI